MFTHHLGEMYQVMGFSPPTDSKLHWHAWCIAHGVMSICLSIPAEASGCGCTRRLQTEACVAVVTQLPGLALQPPSSLHNPRTQGHITGWIRLGHHSRTLPDSITDGQRLAGRTPGNMTCKKQSPSINSCLQTKLCFQVDTTVCT